MKNNEKKVKTNEKKYEKYNINNETYGQKSTQWKASKYKFGAMSCQGLENFLSCPFSYFWALSKLKKKH